MKKVFDGQKVKEVIRMKKQNEFDLAVDIRNRFDKGELKRELNNMVWMSTIVAPNLPGFEKVWKKNGWIGVISHYKHIDKLEEAAYRGNVKAEYCGDWIRVFGEIAEESPNLNLEKEMFQRHYDKFWDKKKSVNDHMPMSGKGPAFPGNRVRLGTSHKLGDISGEMQAKIKKFGAIQQSSREVRFRNLEIRAISEMSQIGGGMKVWSPQERDICYRIEVAFGLRVGATISGTTTDTLFFLKYFGSWLNGYMDPIFYMLPFATIAAAGHHSLIEVALPLSLWGLIDYTIGNYTSLIPKMKSSSVGSHAIKEILRKYEQNENNRRILVYFLQSEVPAGYWEFESSDQGVFNTMAKADKQLMSQFSAMPKPYMDELTLSKWYRNARQGNPRLKL
ncbi:hypothetical protein E9993_20000 [Labilibacter sediminis]|nr:hypothetical protein E9993_20000 [Labilibacter sediminis]